MGFGVRASRTMQNQPTACLNQCSNLFVKIAVSTEIIAIPNFFVCVNFDGWQRGVDDHGDNLCLNEGVIVPQIPEPQTIFPGPVNITINQRLRKYTRTFEKNCENERATNYLVAQMFLTLFRLDQKDRKTMMKTLFEKSLGSGLDLDGQPIDEVAQQVFEKNLTYTNKRSLKKGGQLEFASSFTGLNFDSVFTPLNIYPLLQYLELDDGSGSACSGKLNNLVDASPLRTSDISMQTFIDDNRILFDMNRWPTFEQGEFSPLSLGFKKNKNPVLYYRVRVKLEDLEPQIFSLNLSNVSLEATALAKPFGGRIGPDETKDLLLKPQLDYMSQDNTQILPPQMQPNYSRYPGDPWGLIDVSLHDNNAQFFLRKNITSNAPYRVDLFDHFGLEASHPHAHDPLSLDDGEQAPNEGAPFHFVRIMELFAIVPDAFDITYYSIANNYTEVYFPKVCRLLTGSECSSEQGMPILGTQGFVRGDFGHPFSQTYFDKNSSEKKVFNSFIPFFNLDEANALTTQFSSGEQNLRQYPYVMRDPSHFLTSWAPTTQRNRYENYSFPQAVFAQCHESIKNKDVLIPSGCKQGGRSGYSVKLVSCAALRNQQENVADVFCGD